MSNPGKVHSEIGRGIGYGAAIVIGIAVIAFIAAWVFGFFSDTTVERRGQTAQQEQTQGTGAYRIANYDAFFDRCQAIVASEGRLRDLEAGSTGDQIDRTNILAERTSRRDLVAAYNADAAKTGTAGQFRDSNLPSYIDPEGTSTRCTA